MQTMSSQGGGKSTEAETRETGPGSASYWGCEADSEPQTLRSGGCKTAVTVDPPSGVVVKTQGNELADCFPHTHQAKSVLFPLPRHTFWQFRHDNPKTRVGSPPPEGLPGFNSGVMLLNLEAMRQSPLYDRLLEPAQVQQLADKYHFRGHLGDQDFFTMIGMEHPELFHVLDCTWNRQLCTWWRDHGYSDVFDAYFRCEGHVKIYHGNCNTPIPEA